MKLRLRLLWLLLSSLFKAPLSALDTSVIHLRVLINDVDIRKVSGDRYFALADLGWGDLYMRWGAFNRVLKGECAPVGQVLTIKVRYPLSLFQAFDIHTRVLWWDERWIYAEQRFTRNDEVVAIIISKGGLLKEAKLLPTAEWVPGLPAIVDRPDQPESVRSLQQLEKALLW